MTALWTAANLLSPVPAVAADLPPKAADDDVRLKTPVTVIERGVSLAELLAELKKQSGVDIKLADTTPAGGGDFVLAVSVRDYPLNNLLSGIWSLLSYRGAGWHWDVAASSKKRSYRLIRSLNARNLPARLVRDVQLQFEANVERLVRLESLPEDERKRLAETDPAVAPLMGPGGDRVWAGIKTFKENVPPTRWQEVLRGEALRIPVDQLTPAGRDYVESELKLGAGLRQQAGLVADPRPAPAYIEFSLLTTQGKSTPSLSLILDGRGGGSIFGGAPLAKSFNDRLKSFWLQPGDLEGDPRQTRTIKLPEEKPSAVRRQAPKLADRLLQVSEYVPVPLLGLVGTRSSGAVSPDQRTLQKYLEEVHSGDHRYPWKWRRGLLLVTAADWFLQISPASPLDRRQHALGK